MGSAHSILTDEIITHILTYVDSPTLFQCALVNRQLYITTRPLLWRAVYLPRDRAIAFLFPLTTANDLGHSIQHLCLEDFDFTDNLLLLLMRQTPSMVSMVLDNGERITDQSMQYVPYYWPGLLSIQLTGSPMTNFDVFNTLRHLELWGCFGLSGTTFATPFALEFLIIDMHDPLALDLTGLARLRQLRVYGGLGKISHGWPLSLTSLYLDECVDWMDQDVLPLVQSCPRLTHLTLQDGIFTDILLAMIAMFLPDLEHLDVSYNDQLTAQGVRHFVHQARALRWITLTYCGMTMAEFPEAGDHHAGQVRNMMNTVVRLNHLDLGALEGIRNQPL